MTLLLSCFAVDDELNTEESERLCLENRKKKKLYLAFT